MRRYSLRIFTTWLCCLALLIFDRVSAQNFNIQTYTTRDGLSHNDVRGVAIDSSGFMWIATWDGLSRYDGHTFKNYFHDPNDSLSLPYFSVYNLFIDGGNNLWIITDVLSVARYDPESDAFIRIDYIFDSIPEFCKGAGIDELGFFWLFCNDKVFKFDFRINKFIKYDLCDETGFPKNFEQIPVNSTISISGDKIWVTAGNVFEFEKSAGDKLILKNEYLVERKTGLKNYDFNYTAWFRIYHSESGKKWIFSNTGLYLLDRQSGIFSEFREPFPVNEFSGSGYLCWSWYEEGIYIYDLNEAKFSHIPHENSQLVRSIFCQNKNLVWFSNNSMTGGPMGLSRVVFTPDYFKNYLLSAGNNDSPAIYAIALDKQQRIWVGMRGKNQLISITPDFKTLAIDIPEHLTSADPGAIRSLTLAPHGLWIGFFRELLLFYDFTSGEFTRYITGAVGHRPIAIDKEGDMYLAGRKDNNTALIHFSPQLKGIKETIGILYLPPIYKILIDKNDIVWCGMNFSHILRFDPETEKTEVFLLSKGNYNVEDICEGDNGDLWMALLGGGVCNFDPATGRKDFYTTSDGLANNMTYSILKDDAGNIWVSTNTGISRINPVTGIIRTFGLSEGLNINEFNSGASTIGENGEFYMGGMGGLVSFFPDKINVDELEAGEQKIIITELAVSGEPRLFKGSAHGTDTITLKKGENNFRLFFSSSDFINSDKTVYRYKLPKINTDWVEADSRSRNASYANLKPGWYNFELQATDRTGSWNASKEIMIRIIPLYYQTLIFRITVPVAVLLLAGSMIYIYIRQLKQREAQKQAALRLQSLRGQMNPHFIFNSLNSINYFISKNDKLSANRYIADFSKLIRSILHNLSHDFISLEKEIESIEDYLKIEYLRFGDKFEYEVIVDKVIDHSNLKVSPGMIQPFVENAIWHGVRGLESRKGRIEVWFGMKYGRPTCVVKDDGIGRKRAEMLKMGNDQKKSKGITIVLERLKILNGLQGTHYQIVLADTYPGKNDSGTTVEIDIPVVKEWS